MRKVIFLVSLLLLSGSRVFADGFTENFDNVASLSGSGWVTTNNSNPPGLTSWFQGNTGIFNAQSGAADSYIAANFNNAGVPGDISNWLLTPTFDLSNGFTLTFFTRTETGAPFADNLEVRLSTNGASSDVGATATSVGDFTTLLLVINPALAPDGYPQDWTQYTVSLLGLAPGTQGRLAFRYLVPDTLDNADYIGIDTVNVDTPEPAALSLLLVGLAAFGFRKRLHKRVS